MCRAFHFPAKVAPAALAYLQRFFTRASVLDHHPRDVMLAAVYVACKVIGVGMADLRVLGKCHTSSHTPASESLAVASVFCVSNRL
jgi:hypothetical protein